MTDHLAQLEALIEAHKYAPNPVYFEKADEFCKEPAKALVEYVRGLEQQLDLAAQALSQRAREAMGEK
jgi:hypothetical protein